MSLTDIFLILSGGMLTIFGFLSIMTLLISISKRNSDTNRKEARQRVREELFDLLQESDPNWQRWFRSLSEVEREVLKSVLYRYLRLVKGSQRDAFLRVANELGLGEEADGMLDDSGEQSRIRALSILAVLDHEIPFERLVATCSDSQRVREVASELLYRRREEYDAAEERGTELLIWDGQKPISVYGLETLAELNGRIKTPLLSYAQQTASEWNQTVLIQVCNVLENVAIVDKKAPFDWLFPYLEANEAAVRAAAVRAFKQQGWRYRLRGRLNFESLINDESKLVRRAAYEVLTFWGDEHAKELLESAAKEEISERCQLVAIRGLVSLDEESFQEASDWPGKARKWIQAEIEISERKTMPSPPYVNELS